VQGIDMVATMLDAAGADLDDSPARSLLPLLDRAQSHRESAVSMIRLRAGTPTWTAVTDGRHRLTFDSGTGEPVELFDLDADPDEAVNLVSTAPPEQLAQLSDTADATLA
jgi:arylsulfatase A-like enzyme